MKINRLIKPILSHLAVFAAGILLMLFIASERSKEIRAANQVYAAKNQQLEADLRAAVERGVKVETALNLCREQLKDLKQLY